MDKAVEQVALRLMRGLDTPFSLGTYILMKHGEWDQIARRKIDPAHYIDSPFGAEKLRRDYQAADLLRKCPDLPIDTDRRKAALDTFWQCEQQCARTNQRFRRLAWPLFEDAPTHAKLGSYLARVKKLIKEVLGPVPESLELRFGPGTAFEFKGCKFTAPHQHVSTWDNRHKRKQKPDVKGKRSTERLVRRGLTLGDKLTVTPASTAGALDIVQHYLWPSAWGRGLLRRDISHRIQITQGNRFTTVSKTALTDRGICVEPGGNLTCQLGVGRHIRRRLKYFGIDLKHGQELHRRLAHTASLTGAMSTVDMSNASDTIALEVVRYLLPGDWYDLLFALRSPKTLVDGRWILLEKFSSMGNGFTFELETLIFACIAAALTDGRRALGRTVFAYGDDLIIQTPDAENTLAALRFFGFTPNERKTFVTGSFRESCGGDYFCGYDVRPHLIEESPHDTGSWISLANGLFRRGRNAHLRNDPSFRARLYAIDQLPVTLRHRRGPAALGDVIIHDVELNYRGYKWEDSIRYFRCNVPQSDGLKHSHFPAETQFALALYGAGADPITWRDSPMGYVTRWIPYS